MTKGESAARPRSRLANDGHRLAVRCGQRCRDRFERLALGVDAEPCGDHRGGDHQHTRDRVTEKYCVAASGSISVPYSAGPMKPPRPVPIA